MNSFSTVAQENWRAFNQHYPEYGPLVQSLPEAPLYWRWEKSGANQQTLIRQFKSGEEIFLADHERPLQVAAAEVKNFAPETGQHIICLGFGLGYHVRELLKAVGERGRVDVVFLHPSSLRMVFSSTDFRDLIEHPRCTFILGNLSEIADYWRRPRNISPRIYYHEPSLAAVDESLRPLVEMIERLRIERARVWYAGDFLKANYQRNLGWLAAARGIDDLAGAFTQKPAIIVAAGPSLDQNAEELKHFQNKALLLVVDTAVRRVLAAGAQPDLIFTVDPNRASLRHFQDVPPTLPLAFLLSAFPGVVEKQHGPKLGALPRGDQFGEALHHISGKGLVTVAGTVTFFALEAARRWGCNPIIFTGLDLALTGGRMHYAGAATVSSRPRGRRLVEAIDGGMVETTDDLDRFRQAIELRIAEEPHITFVDATGGGARINGTSIMTLAQVEQKWNLTSSEPLSLSGFGPPCLAPASIPDSWQHVWHQFME